jgi:hypothetical protein
VVSSCPHLDLEVVVVTQQLPQRSHAQPPGVLSKKGRRRRSAAVADRAARDQSAQA